jgi:hypothetical protein
MSIFVDHPNRTNANLVVDAQGFRYLFISKKEKAAGAAPLWNPPEVPS